MQGLTYKPEDVKKDGTLVLRSSNIQNSVLCFNDNVYVSSDMIPSKISTKSNDVLMCVRNGSRNLVGKTALISQRYAGLAWGAFMNILRPHKNNTFIYFFLNTRFFRNPIDADFEHYKSDLAHNPILNPVNNYSFNKYLEKEIKGIHKNSISSTFKNVGNLLINK